MTDFFETLVACDPEPAAHIARARARELNTASGKKIVIDEEDFAKLPKGSLFVTPNGYAYIDFYRDGTSHKVGIHRLIMGLETGDERVVDHINGDKLDNRRCNLRVVTQRQNSLNRQSANRTSKTGVLGVRYDARRAKNPYRAEIEIKGEKVSLGCFPTADEASAAYQAAKSKAIAEAVVPGAPSRAQARAFAPAVNMLCLDIGTHCGWAFCDRGGNVTYGTEKFPIRTAGPGVRWSQFRAWLAKIIVDGHVGVVYFEDVKAHGPGQVIAAHTYGGFLAMAQMVCAQHNVRMVGVGVGTVKKAFTGKGNAKKPEMITTAQAKGFRVANDEDDTADALAILAYGVAQEA